jgi:tRNA pseudouridine55 synthase
MATGVLVLGVGRGTRLLGHLALRDKRYLATVRLGVSTVTDDADGEITAVAPAQAVQALDDADVQEAFLRQVGTIRQRPSAVSAIKVDGQRAYDLVRGGAEVDLPARTVTVSRIDVLDMRWAPGHLDVDIDVECSTGTYVRAIARDAGELLGVGGHLTSLRRTRVGPFTLEQSIPLERLSERGVDEVRPLDSVVGECFSVWQLGTDEDASWVRNGRRIPWRGPDAPDGPVAIIDPAGAFLALAEDDGGTARYLAVFVPPGA